jgi:hypothetical protein
MGRLLRAFPFTIAAILVLGGGLAFAAHAALTQTSAPVPPGATGIPVLTPGFTESGVRAYFATHFFSLGRTPSGGHPPISSVQFITREQAEAAMNGDSLDQVAPGHIVCYVTFAGPIVASGIGGPPRLVTPGQTPVPHKPETFTSGYMVFDATTGDLLVSGVTGWQR